jgi:hypothetical protein
MRIAFKIVEIINSVALLFLLLGGYGLGMTGVLQVIAALLFLAIFPKNKLIYIYFGIVILFFLIWDRKSMDWLFIMPIFLIFFMTFIIYKQKKHFT